MEEVVICYGYYANEIDGDYIKIGTVGGIPNLEILAIQFATSLSILF